LERLQQAAQRGLGKARSVQKLFGFKML
jgi:hypothetical protein